MKKNIVKRLIDSLDYEFDLSFNDRKQVLSYIEQLENNRDKAIEYIEEGRDGDYCDALSATGLLNILKGDSDES